VRRANARLSIGCIYSGRLPRLLPKWFNSLCQNVSRARLASPPELVILDNSADQADALYRHAAKRAVVFSSVRILPFPSQWMWTSERERRDQVASFMADASNRILTETVGELVWLVEDDIVPPACALASLFKTATEGFPLPAAVAAPYRNRHTGTDYVAGWFRNGIAREIGELPRDLRPLPVDIAGTGCLLFWRDLAPRRFESHIKGAGGPIAAHDWAFTQAMIDRGRKVVMLPEVRCRHHLTQDEWV